MFVHVFGMSLQRSRRGSKRGEKKYRQQMQQAAKAHLSADGPGTEETDAKPGVRFHLSGSFRRLSISSGGGSSSKRGILKQRKKGNSFDEPESVPASGLVASSSFDAPSPGSKRRNSLFSRMFGSSIDEGVKSDDSGSVTYSARRSPLSAVSLQAAGNCPPNALASSLAFHSPSGSDIASSPPLSMTGQVSRQESFESTGDSQDRPAGLKGKFDPAACEAPMIRLRRSSDSATALDPSVHIPLTQ